MPSDITIEKKAARDVTKLLEKHENLEVSRYLKKFLELRRILIPNISREFT